MKTDLKKLLDNGTGFKKLPKYVENLPDDILDFFVNEDPDALMELELRLRKLRTREAERNYVMEIQSKYKLPLRPNETLKETMIRVRLNILKTKNKPRKNRSNSDPGSFPIDPLE